MWMGDTNLDPSHYPSGPYRYVAHNNDGQPWDEINGPAHSQDRLPAVFGVAAGLMQGQMSIGAGMTMSIPSGLPKSSENGHHSFAAGGGGGSAGTGAMMPTSQLPQSSEAQIYSRTRRRVYPAPTFEFPSRNPLDDEGKRKRRSYTSLQKVQALDYTRIICDDGAQTGVHGASAVLGIPCKALREWRKVESRLRAEVDAGCGSKKAQSKKKTKSTTDDEEESEQPEEKASNPYPHLFPEGIPQVHIPEHILSAVAPPLVPAVTYQVPPLPGQESVHVPPVAAYQVPPLPTKKESHESRNQSHVVVPAVMPNTANPRAVDRASSPIREGTAAPREIVVSPTPFRVGRYGTGL